MLTKYIYVFKIALFSVVDRSKPVKISTNDAQDVIIKWETNNVSSAIDPPCISIVNLTTSLPLLHSVDVCYSSNALYNQSWICSQNDTITFSFVSMPSDGRELVECASVAQTAIDSPPCDPFIVCDRVSVTTKTTGLLGMTSSISGLLSFVMIIE